MSKSNQKRDAERNKLANKAKAKSGQPTLAQQADLHELYEKAVQIPEFEVEFMGDTYRELRKRQATSLREDFCGTGLLARQWCRSKPNRTAIGVDLSHEVLEWGRTHNLEPFASELNGRLSLVQGDATMTESPPVDIVCAFNFSFCVFKKRAELLRYFQRAYASLAPGGLFFLDIYGGTEAIVELKEDRSVEKFTYIWEQSKFNPLTHETTCHIHFKFKDGSRLSPAFTYEWRLWTVPELREVLEEAGFADSRIYWEEMEASDDDDEDEMLEGSGVFAPATEVENQESWVCYVVGLKDKL